MSKVSHITLSQGKVALVSVQDFEKVNRFKWCASNESKGRRKWYAVRGIWLNQKSARIRMHRFILGLGSGLEDARIVNHINDDGLDNRRENLEILDSNNSNMTECPGWKRKKVEEPFL